MPRKPRQTRVPPSSTVGIRQFEPPGVDHVCINVIIADYLLTRRAIMIQSSRSRALHSSGSPISRRQQQQEQEPTTRSLILQQLRRLRVVVTILAGVQFLTLLSNHSVRAFSSNVLFLSTTSGSLRCRTTIGPSDGMTQTHSPQQRSCCSEPPPPPPPLLANRRRERTIRCAQTRDNTPSVVPGESTSAHSRFTIGLIADIQYAPIPDGFSYAGMPRYYRHSLETTRTAFAHFERERVPLVINLGDTVDGKCQQITLHGGDPVPKGVHPGHYALDHVVDAMSIYRSGTVIHAYGNHCLYNLDRSDLAARLGIPFVREPCGDLVGYSAHSYGGIRFLVLDSYDVAKMRRCEKSSWKYQQAVRILREKNPNYHLNENSPSGLADLDKRFVAFNGAVGPIQLQWLQQELAQVRARNQEKVVVLSHQPILPGSTSATCLMWNFQEVLDVLREYRDVVIASFAGHAHMGGYRRDPESGIHFRVFEAALENPYPYQTYALIDFFPDHLSIRGYGNCKSAQYYWDHHEEQPKQDCSDSSNEDSIPVDYGPESTNGGDEDVSQTKNCSVQEMLGATGGGGGVRQSRSGEYHGKK